MQDIVNLIWKEADSHVLDCRVTTATGKQHLIISQGLGERSDREDSLEGEGGKLGGWWWLLLLNLWQIDRIEMRSTTCMGIAVFLHYQLEYSQ